MKLTGQALKLGDNINTDFIISGRYKFAITDMKELAKHIMEDIDPGFAAKIKPGKSMIIAGNNFGMGSSREQAPLVIKEAGVVAVLAKSFARIFYRNAFNIGLALVETDTDKIGENDLIEINLDKGIARNTSKNIDLTLKPFPKFMQELLREGGIVNYYRKHGELKV
ncbi:MAG: 3-isopropylmalate dehydratase small subunit [Candidatus Omnitrophota bacterium]|jgi:3-isopropylmalate/(R)-2-methylmalate dehydratase small subunit|nr:3-isopropylmalate dehydratase small subunit [Candidatus Omnitrophota bacterium]